jgi:hypothetical protein
MVTIIGIMVGGIIGDGEITGEVIALVSALITIHTCGIIKIITQIIGIIVIIIIGMVIIMDIGMVIMMD